MEEFKKFINKGNVVEMAVGLILATYFGAIVKSLVNDVIMPPVGMLIGGVDFSELKVVIQKAVLESAEGAGDGIPEVAINYGLFINNVLIFLIVGYCIFIAVKTYNRINDRFKKKEAQQPEAPPTPPQEEVLLTEIRDLLKEQKTQ